MNCPHCQVCELKMTDRQGIEVDYCPQCRGVWLDRGELDKIIERSTGQSAVGLDDDDYREPYPNRRPEIDERRDDRDHGGQRYPDHDDNHRYKGRRKSFWRELFDFD